MAYPEIDTVSNKVGVLERHGYSPIGDFVLPDDCWMQNYYQPMSDRFEGFLAEHRGDEAAQAIVEAERAEMALYEQYRRQFGYVMYIARKPA